MDLLHPEPALRLRSRPTREAIAFGFAVGEGEEQLAREFDQMTLAPSSFDQQHFAPDLFIESLVEESFPITIEGTVWEPHKTHLARLLTQPPTDPSITAFRRDILRELASDASLRRKAESLYVKLRLFRQELTRSVDGSFPEQHQHRMEVLRSLLAVFSTIGEGFEGTTSGLSRLAAYGARIREGVAYQRLASFISFEGAAAAVNVDLRVGADGDVRNFELAKVEEATASPFHRSPWRRFVTRVTLFFRGYKFGELEVLARVLDEIFSPLEAEVLALFQLTLDLEVYLGALGLSDRAAERGLAVCLPEFASPTDLAASPRTLRGLWNPLLLADRGRPKPSDLLSKRLDALVLVTGPNSGGKTRLLQALAFAQLLGQMGVFVPAAEARIAWTHGLFVSLHHEVSASQREGRLGTELMRIRQLFEEVSVGDLVIFDELCSGTNPSEAEAIMRLVLELLSELSPQVFVTTHFLDFARQLEKEAPWPSLEFLQAALDEKKRPTFTFTPGVANSALAAETAARLGVTLEELASAVARRKSGARDVELPDALSAGPAPAPSPARR